jgi:hypothetical protein
MALPKSIKRKECIQDFGGKVKENKTIRKAKRRWVDNIKLGLYIG